MGFGLFHPYGTNFNLPNLSSLIWCTKKMPISLVLKGSQVHLGITRATEEETHDDNAQPSKATYSKVADSQADGELPFYSTMGQSTNDGEPSLTVLPN